MSAVQALPCAMSGTQLPPTAVQWYPGAQPPGTQVVWQAEVPLHL